MRDNGFSAANLFLKRRTGHTVNGADFVPGVSLCGGGKEFAPVLSGLATYLEFFFSCQDGLLRAPLVKDVLLKSQLGHISK
jgi:hypothetical protein